MNILNTFSRLRKSFSEGAEYLRFPFSKERAELKLLVRELSQHSEEMAHLGRLAEMLQACATLPELAKVISASAKDIFPSESGALYLLKPGQASYDREIAWGEPAPELSETFQMQDCWAIRRGKPHYQASPSNGLFCDHISPASPAFSFCLPLAGQDGALGLLHLRAGPLGLPMSEARRLVAIALAYQGALGLSNLRLKETLREEAIRDPVTGLFNRRYMKESLEHEIHRAQREGSSVAIISFDLDHFKDVNDSLGHAAGDSLLIGLSQLVKSTLRAEDICCRQGGDEFLLILPNITEKSVRALAETLRQNADAFTRQQFPSLAGKVTLSVGLALYPQDAPDSEALQKAADQALYRAKSLGRNRVVAAKDPA